MEFIGSYTFNRGQTITIWKGPKSSRVSLQLFNTEGNPFKYLAGPNKDTLILKAWNLLKVDIAKDGQEPTLMESDGEPFPFRVKTEDDVIQEFLNSTPVKKLLGDMRESKKQGEALEEFSKESSLSEEDRKAIKKEFGFIG